jgi:peptide/nickel transport system substrate-binding protein
VEHIHRRRRRRPGLIIAAGLISFGLIAAACGGDDDDDASETTTAQATTTAGGATTTAGGGEATTTSAAPSEAPTPGGTLRVGVEAETNGWVPAIMQCDSACQIRAKTVFETVTIVDDEVTVKPYLAESIEPNADHTLWTIKVRDGVTFHDGTKLDAAAMAKSLARNSVTGFVGSAVENIVGAGPGMPVEGVGIKVVDPMTLTVQMKKPWVDFPYYMSSQIGMIGAPAWYDKVFANPAAPDAVAGASPVGTGPFVFESWQPGDTFKVKKNPNYWRKDADGNAMPYLDGIEFRVIPDELTRANALKSGELDMMPTDNGVNIAEFKDNGDFQYLEQADLGETGHILLNVGQEGSPLQDQRVRCGLAAAVDPKVIADQVHEGSFPVANGPRSPGQQGYLEDNGWPGHDPELAKRLIAEYTAEKGKPTIKYSTTTDSTNLRTAQLIQQWWTDAGVNVEVNQIEQQKIILDALLGDPNFNAFGWRNHGGPLIDNQYVWWHSSLALPPGQPALNFGRMKDPAIDQALDTARASDDPAEQTAQAEIVNQQFVKECWIIPLYWQVWGTVMSPAVQGIRESTAPDGEIMRAGNGFPGQEWFYQAWLKQ